MREKEAVSSVIGVILMVAITVLLAAVLYVWVIGFTGGTEMTPFVSLDTQSEPTSDGSFVNTTFRVTGVSRNTIKWTDLDDPAVFVNGTPIVPDDILFIVGGNKHAGPNSCGAGEYVSSSDTIKIVLNETQINDGGKLELMLVYEPTRTMAGAVDAVYAP